MLPQQWPLYQRLSTIAASRDLLVELVRKDYDARYAGSILGALWTQLYPLLLLGVYVLVFSVILPTNIPRFPVFAFVGIVVWHFFSTAVLLATTSVVANLNLITRVAFPRELVTVSAVAIGFVDLALSHGPLLVAGLVYGVRPTLSWLALPPLLVLFGVFCLGIGLMLATAGAYLLDVKFFVEVAITLLMFLSPIFYHPEVVPDSVAWIMWANPLAVMMTAYRQAFIEGLWPSLPVWVSLTGVAFVALLLGTEIFQRGARRFADVL